jgi:hypothetical protein
MFAASKVDRPCIPAEKQGLSGRFSVRKEGVLMARIDGVNPEEVDEYTSKVLQAQARTWGAPLLNHLVYARRPSIFRGARAMWAGIAASGLIDEKLQALVNRRVASLNGCVF